MDIKIDFDEEYVIEDGPVYVYDVYLGEKLPVCIYNEFSIGDPIMLPQISSRLHGHVECFFESKDDHYGLCIKFRDGGFESIKNCKLYEP